VQLPEEESRPSKPLAPCAVCEAPTSVHPVLERWPLCLGCLGDWFSDGRFRGGFEANVAAMPAWVAERRAGREAA
jgi:hypothetical protein